MTTLCFKSVVTLLAALPLGALGNTLYVAANGTNPVAPYADWSTAATNIQDAIDAAQAGDTVVVTNGTYASGGRSPDGVITNRVTVDQAITVQSVNGAAVTIIQGAWDPVSTNGAAAVRCVWLTNNATLSGFTIRGGATRTSASNSGSGGGIFGNAVSATVTGCVLSGNAAFANGGGAYRATLNSCELLGNVAAAIGQSSTALGGGASQCNLQNCVISGNTATANGSGVYNCNSTNCAFTGNFGAPSGTIVYGGYLVNCTVANSIGTGFMGCKSASLLNSIVWTGRSSGPNYANYNSCTFKYSDSDPLPAGVGNLDADPQLLSDYTHLAETSPCIGAGTNSVTLGTDIDGQSWNNPPSMGCDEWYPGPVIARLPEFQVNPAFRTLTYNILAAGAPPFSYSWIKDGVPIQDDGHYFNSGSANLFATNFGPDDGGAFQVVVTNNYGAVTSQVTQLTIHAVDAAGANPVPPYSTWATAAMNIQDAIDAASAGDIVLVTNGVYARGGRVSQGTTLTNRITLDKPISMASVNGYSTTTIRGAWDPATTNGPAAVRCAWLSDGASLFGFTLQNGATRVPAQLSSVDGIGGGVACTSTNPLVWNCVLTNNAAGTYGGGAYAGTLNNCLVVGNIATKDGGAAIFTTLNNCSVWSNVLYQLPLTSAAAGLSKGIAYNSILVGNMESVYPQSAKADIYSTTCYYCFTYNSTPITGTSNFNTLTNSSSPQIIDGLHITATSPCHGAGSAAYAVGMDLDGDPWANPPSMGCTEVINSELVGPLTVSIQASATNAVPAKILTFHATIAGRASGFSWSYGDGQVYSNQGLATAHLWNTAGDYPLTFTAFNNDNPGGVSASIQLNIGSLTNPPVIEVIGPTTNGFQFQFGSVAGAQYYILSATNLTPPIIWQTQSFMGASDMLQFTDHVATSTGSRFYRVFGH